MSFFNVSMVHRFSVHYLKLARWWVWTLRFDVEIVLSSKDYIAQTFFHLQYYILIPMLKANKLFLSCPSVIYRFSMNTKRLVATSDYKPKPSDRHLSNADVDVNVIKLSKRQIKYIKTLKSIKIKIFWLNYLRNQRKTRQHHSHYSDTWNDWHLFA